LFDAYGDLVAGVLLAYAGIEAYANEAIGRLPDGFVPRGDEFRQLRSPRDAIEDAEPGWLPAAIYEELTTRATGRLWGLPHGTVLRETNA
jgi:hypothetical protein